MHTFLLAFFVFLTSVGLPSTLKDACAHKAIVAGSNSRRQGSARVNTTRRRVVSQVSIYIKIPRKTLAFASPTLHDHRRQEFSHSSTSARFRPIGNGLSCETSSALGVHRSRRSATQLQLGTSLPSRRFFPSIASHATHSVVAVRPLPRLGRMSFGQARQEAAHGTACRSVPVLHVCESVLSNSSFPSPFFVRSAKERSTRSACARRRASASEKMATGKLVFGPKDSGPHGLFGGLERGRQRKDGGSLGRSRQSSVEERGAFEAARRGRRELSRRYAPLSGRTGERSEGV